MKRRTARISEEAYKLLLAKKESTGKSVIELASEYVSIGVSYNLQDEGWEERIHKQIDDLDKKKARV